jgi:DNA-binding CsgD family transcriptional regulator/tetratricopeptide (TPR) repeat protein
VTDVLCPVVVGREAELSVLRAALAAALDGAGGLVFVTGEPGIGKSRLARELADQARSQGAAVVTGRAVPAGGSIPYRPLTEALLQALRDRPQPDGPDLAPWLPALRTIVPALGLWAAGGPDEPSLGEGGAPTAIRGEAVLRLGRWLSDPGGLVMVLEDLQWADPDTLAVVEYLGDNLVEQRVLCLATSRSEPPSAALEMIRRLHGRRAAVHLPLGRLDDPQVAGMVRACLPGADPDFIARIQQAADGVPFLVEEVLASPGVPASFGDTVRERLCGLGEDEHQVLAGAAVLGRHFDWRLLGRVTGQPQEVVTRALERGVGQLLLTVEGDGFRFRHALTREAVAATVLPPRRAALAAAALAVVQAAHPQLPGSWRDLAADLAIQAGDGDQAGLLLAASGRESLQRGALATAVGTLQRAARLLSDPARRADAESQLVEALALAGRVDEAVAVGTSLSRRLAADPATGAARAQLHLRLAHAAVTATRWPDAASHLASAAGLLASAPQPALSAQVDVLSAEVALASDELSRAHELAASALAVTGTAPETRCHALELIGRSERLRNPAAAQRAFERALVLAEEAGLPFWRLRALHELGTIELFDHCGTRRLAEAREMAGKLGALSTAAVLDLQLTAAGDSRFELAEANRHATDCLAISEQLGLPQVRAKALCFLAENAGMRRDGEQAEHFITLALAAADGDRAIEAFCWGASRGMQAVLEDRLPAAVQAFSRAAAILRECPNAEPASFRGLWLVMLAAIRDERAAEEMQRARQAGITTAFSNHGMLSYAEAILAGQAGEPGRAAELAAAAEIELARYPVWADLARMYAAEAALTDGWGHPQGWLRASRRTFAAHGLARLASRCDKQLGGPTPGHWDGLGVTAREADVLRLVAEGLANKEIAARLFLSPRTVEKHVESLLRKTGARSRTQLVAITSPPAASSSG